MSKVTTRHWAAYTRNQEAVAAAIARKEYMDLTSTGVGVVDEFFALMDGVGMMNRLAVEGVYQRRLVPMVLEITTYLAKVIMGLSSQNQLPTHLFTDAGLLRRIGYTAKQVDEGFCVACAYKTERGQELADRGIRRLRAQHLGGAGWVLVVYTETEYGIFDVEEFAHLSGNPPKRFHRFRT